MFIETVTFTQKEKLLLKLLCEDKTTAEIADIMEISPRTVESIRQKAKDKADVKSIGALVYYAVKNKIVPLFPN